jgi:hypothetical protein
VFTEVSKTATDSLQGLSAIRPRSQYLDYKQNCLRAAGGNVASKSSVKNLSHRHTSITYTGDYMLPGESASDVIIIRHLCAGCDNAVMLSEKELEYV